MRRKRAKTASAVLRSATEAKAARVEARDINATTFVANYIRLNILCF